VTRLERTGCPEVLRPGGASASDSAAKSQGGACKADARQMQGRCTADARQMQGRCSAHAVHTQCTRSAHAVHTQCTRSTCMRFSVTLPSEIARSRSL
jgi:hypothetical protein